MLIEQIIEFELRGCGPPGRTCNAKTGFIFMAKQRFSRKINHRVNYYVLLNALQEAMNFASHYLRRVNYKIYEKMPRFKREL